jgi:Cdc6-like AAA superfamily ATPase
VVDATGTKSQTTFYERLKAMPKLLILASNPRGDLKNLDREIRDLKATLKRLNEFDIEVEVAVTSQNLKNLIASSKPHIVHFCGHGAGKKGLILQDDEGNEKIVKSEELAYIFETFSSNYQENPIICVVLNACESVHQANLIVEHVDYAVGMKQKIGDKAAYHFSLGFYTGLANGISIEQAFRLGVSQIRQWLDESNSQSTQSRQYRKAEYVGPVEKDAQLELPEYEKPDLQAKSTRLTPNTVAIDSVTKVSSSPLTAPSNIPQGFVEFVQQEIDRKEYKDRARAAYDNFGQFSAQNAASLTKSEYKQRKIFLGKVKRFWIEGFLKPSLQDVAAMKLDLKARPDVIADLTQGIEALSVELDASYERLRTTQIYGEIGQGQTLLILGVPGAGKTIALLQLTQRLIERSEKNPSLPMPVVFNLSSWAKEQKSIVDWLIDDLQEKYQVPKSLSEPWIKQQQLILLLDGLDEVKEEHRNDCVRALNEFIGRFSRAEVAVCSRVRDYEVLTERLQISSALCLQPLSVEQVYQFLDNVGGSLAGVKALLKSDMELEQFAQTPLILNFMSVAYRGWSANKLIPQLRSTQERHQNLFNTYIDCRLAQGATSEYSKEQVLRWLRWLANRMVKEKRTIFLIERMQPSWLQNRSEEKTYRIIAIMLSGLIVGAIGWGLGELIFVLINGTKNNQLLGLSGGISGALIGGIIIGLPKKILPLEQLGWSWKRAKDRFVREFLEGVSYGLIFGVIFGLIFYLNGQKFMNWSIGGLVSGLIGGLILGLGSGLGSSEIEQRIVSNQGIRSSLRNCLIIGLIVGLIGSAIGSVIGGLSGGLSGKLIFGPIFEAIHVEINAQTGAQIGGLVFGPIGGLISGLKYGGAACVQHFILRLMMYQKGYIPWNYAKLLDLASDRLLMKKVGGGYVFFHRMLLEHFAQMNSN